MYLPLQKAVDQGEWENAKRFIDGHPDAVRVKITTIRDTALHIATDNGNVLMVDKLIQLMSAEDLELKDINGDTALSRAALGGNTKIAELLVRKSTGLVCIPNNYGFIPVTVAAGFGFKDTVRFLYSVTPEVEFNP
uniref:Uncharacterized protein n=1 Tax=Nelumbo nucifera TaxID=4432 RepID=A0A822XTV8_NELNU|nr:TPA_asm: hypothetical protein HUJ06_024074 [Nelumbo nucifera]